MTEQGLGQGKQITTYLHKSAQQAELWAANVLT